MHMDNFLINFQPDKTNFDGFIPRGEKMLFHKCNSFHLFLLMPKYGPIPAAFLFYSIYLHNRITNIVFNIELCKEKHT